VERITIRRSKRIRKSRKIRIQLLCSEHLSWVLYLFLGRNERFHSKIKSLTLRGYLCVTFLCEEKGEKHGRKLYLSFCNGKWLKVVWILMFFLWCVFYLKSDKGRESSSYQIYIKLCYFYVLVLFFFYKIIILSTLCFSFGVETAFCHMIIVRIWR
jgi:hypothetical protein